MGADACHRLADPRALPRETLLRSYRADESPRWFAAAGLAPPALHGPVFDSSMLMVPAAIAGHGVALVRRRCSSRSAHRTPGAAVATEIVTGHYC